MDEWDDDETPIPAVSADVPVLTAEELEGLDPELRDAYLQALLQELEESPLTPPQMRAHDLCNRVDELLYGGAAGGGKSHFAIWHTDRLSRQFPGHRTLVMRTSFPELRRTLMAKAHEMIDPKAEPGVTYRAADKEWRYGNGSVIEFGYCVAGETAILMGDGSYKRMDLIEPGEYVGTLEGPRRVKRHFHVGSKPSVRMTTAAGASVVASRSHAVLSAGGQWLPPCGPDGTPTPDLLGLSPSAPTGTSGRVDGPPPSATRQGLRRTLRAVAESLGLGALRASGAWVGDDRSSDGSSTGSRRAPRQPQSWFAHLTLHGPAAQSADPLRTADDRCGAWREPTGPRVPGWTDHCSCGCDPCGGPALQAPAVARAHTPSRAGVGTLAPPTTLSDGRGCTPSRSRQERPSYSHPYTSERRDLAVAVHHAPVRICPVDDADLWDMSIEGANHYVSWGGIVHKNCDSIEDVRQYLSAEYDCIVIDESTEMMEEWIEMIRSRLRTTKAKREMGIKPHLLLLTNPGGPSHSFHRDRYVLPTNHGEFVAELDERDAKGRGRFRSVAYVSAKVSDNPYIDPDYEANLVAIKDPVRRAQYLDGDWSVFEGQFFAEFDRNYHVVDPFEIKAEWGWPIIGGYDWGYASPACLLLGAVDQDRRIHIFREMYVERHTAAEQARIFRGWGIKPDYICADPSIWRNTGVGLPVSQQLMHAGMLPLRKASNERVAGWNRVREYLALDDDTGLPQLVIHSNCENLIRTLPDLPRDKNKPEDLDTRTDDHACFPGETLVWALEGARRIDSIRPGDVLLNGAGEWGMVAAAAMTNPDAALVRISTDRGDVECTPDHPFLIEGRGWVRADAVRYHDIIAAWHAPSPSALMASPTAATQTPSDGATAATSVHPATAARSLSTGRSTRPTTGRSPMAGTSTTSTATPATTTPPTLPRFLLPIITRTTDTTARLVARARRLWLWLRSGIEARKDAHGTASTARPPGGSGRPAPSPASNVGRSLTTSPSTPSSAPTTASPLPGALVAWMTKIEPASPASRPSESTATPRPSAARARVLGTCAVERRTGVWALEMFGEHSFVLANGLTVSNCDALRYMLMSQTRGARSLMRPMESYDKRVSDFVTKRAGMTRKKVHDVLGSM